jgi:hypothetical protein
VKKIKTEKKDDKAPVEVESKQTTTTETTEKNTTEE